MRFNRDLYFWIGLSVLVFVSSFSLSGAAAPVMMDPDSSWNAIVEIAFLKNVQFGKDLVFTYGPLGFLSAASSQGFFWEVRIAFALVWSLATTWAVVTVARKLPTTHRYLFLGWYLVFASFTDMEQTFYFVIPCCALVLLHSRKAIAPVLPIILFSLVALIKFTFLLVVVACVVICAIDFTLRRETNTAKITVLGFLIFFVLTWLALGQHWSNLWPWLTSCLAMTAGYSEAMQLFPDHLMMYASFTVAMLWFALILSSTYYNRFTVNKYSAVAMLLFTSFIVWKQGMVRVDAFHAQRYFLTMPLLAGLLFSVMDVERLSVKALRLQLYLFLGIITAALVTATISETDFIPHTFTDYKGKFVKSIAAIDSMVTGKAKDCFESLSADYRVNTNSQLPDAKRIIGDATVDELNFAQWVILANGLNYGQRPVIQGYSAYTPYLQQLNLSYYLGANRPDYFLTAMETIDERYPALDDAMLFSFVLLNYRPVAKDKQFILLKKAERIVLPQLELITEQTVAFDELFLLSQWNNDELVLKVETDLSLLGRLIGFLFQRPNPLITVFANNGQHRYRFIASMAKSGFVINPLIREINDIDGFGGRKWQKVDMIHFTRPNEMSWLVPKSFRLKLYRVV